jgi:general secretion pathway protein E
MKNHLLQILNQRFGIPEEELGKIKTEKSGRTGDILIKKKIITETQLLEAFSIQYNIPFLPRLPFNRIKTDYIETIPIQFLKKHIIVPLFKDSPEDQAEHADQEKLSETDDSEHKTEEPECILAINDIAGFQALDDLVRIIGAHQFKLVFSTQSAILSAINKAYDFNRDSAEQLVQNLEETEEISVDEIEYTADLLDDASDAPIIKLVNQILSQAIRTRASDVHIEPYQDELKVRNRIDGILYTLLTPPKWIQPALTSRIKVMAKMNIAEKRLPQDGRMDIKIGEQEIDIRVSTLPTTFGERVVLRLLNKTGSVLRLSEIGLEPDRLMLMENLVSFPNGIILVTGPTGSGKTTTLYATLSSINKPDINIITIEDPVEYQIQGVSQIQVNPKIDLSFAKGLRSIVRQDPDVILIGEIRDRETAEIAVQSALTGHLVFSTLHTNDSASAIARLVDMGVEPFLISSSIVGIIAQRLVRVLCKKCKQSYTPDATVLKTLGLTPQQAADKIIYRPKGCDQCFNTGFNGRIGIFEIVTMNDRLKSLILKTHDSNIIKKEAVNHGMITLKQNAVQKVLQGIIPVEEIIRVARK